MYAIVFDNLYCEILAAAKSAFNTAAVDEGFEDLLRDMFGAELMSDFRAKRPAGYVDLMIAFESRKRSCGPAKLAPLNIALPFSFIDFYRRQKGKDVSGECIRTGWPKWTWKTSR